MATRLTPDAVLADAAKIVAVWSANPDFALGTLTLADLKSLSTSIEGLGASIADKRFEPTGLVDQRDDKTKALSEIFTRAKSGFRAIYGPDSTQYAQAGGIRKSERKAPTRRTPQPKEL